MSRSLPCAVALGSFVGLFGAERSRQLVEKQRNAVGELQVGGRASGSLRDLVLATRDQLVSIV
jgi:hypothetical protein